MGILNTEFKTFSLNERGIKRAGWVAELFDDLLEDLKEMCSAAPRELALVKTKLEEASFFSKKALALDPLNQTDVQNQ